MKYVSLYEDTDNPYEKTFIDAKDDGERLEILAKDVSYDGSYGTIYVVDKEESEKLAGLLKIEREKLIKWLGFYFRGSRADDDFYRFCRSAGVEVKMYLG
jgi:hypothetical protein